MGSSGKLPAVRWSAERVQTFFDTLAETCNVKEAERAACMGERAAYSRRKRDPEFRAAWEQAIREGYEKLQLIAMERAMNGERKAVRKDGKIVGYDRHYSDRLILTLLAAHKPKATAPFEEAETARRSLAEKIAAAKKKFGDD
ncbi:MAG: hypothetical protein JOY99_18050 [Sphingomonadaceae bacterium]|nr:hypothetical protein [Sphingomonadaceae bacterium]